MNVPQPEYDPNALAGFQGVADQGSGALAGARGAQGQALGMYTDMAQGNGPSLAQAQLAASGAQTVTDQQAMAAQARGGNLAAQARQAQGAGAAAQMGNAQQMAMLQAQEQQANLAGMAGMSNTMAGQGLQQQLSAQGLIGAAAGQSLDASTQWGLGQRGLDLQQLEGNRGMFEAGGIFGKDGFGANILGAVGGTIGLPATVSDIRAKTNIAPSDGAATEAARALAPSNFEYKPGAGPPGQRTGVMAQDLASTPAGAATVVPTEQGLGIDAGQLSTLAMASNAETVQRLDKLERAMGVTDASGTSYGVQPDALTGRVQEQDALAQRLVEEEAILEAKMRRGEPVDDSLAEIERLSKFIDPGMAGREPEPRGVQHAPDPQMGMYRGGGRATVAPMRPWDDISRPEDERTILRANDDMVRRAQDLAGPMAGGGMRI